MKLFECRGCQAKDAEIARLVTLLGWSQKELSAQNKRLLEIAEPNGNARIAAADRPRRPPVVPTGEPPAPRLPDSEPIPPLNVTLTEG